MAQITVADLLGQIAANTIQVLHAPGKKNQWIVLLKAIRQTVTHDEQLGLLIDDVLKLLSGDSVEGLHPQLAPPYSECWTKIVNAVQDTDPGSSSPRGRLRIRLEELNQTSDPSGRIPLLREALGLVDADQDPGLWAQLHVSLAQGLSQLTSGNRRQNLEDAIASFRHALHVITREASPEDWAFVMMCLGNALDMRVAGDPGKNVEEAIATYHQVLEVYRRESFPSEWALTMMNLGIALHNRQVGNAAENVELSIRALKDAATIITPASNPRLWIDLMVNSSNAYLKRHEGDPADNLEKAFHFVQQALSAVSAQNAPMLWVSVATNLAWVLSKRIAGNSLENLEEARHLLLAAEKICDPGVTAMEWLRLSLNLNEVLQKMIPLLREDPIKLTDVIRDMCERIWGLYGKTQSPAVLQQAVSSFQMAVHYTAENSLDLQQYLIRLGICIEDRAQLSKDTRDLDEAIALFERAVRLTAPGTVQLPRNLNSLSLALATRYNWLGELDDLRKSIDNSKRAVALSLDPKDGLVFLKNMRYRVESLYVATKNPLDLKDLADCHSEIIGLSADTDDQIDSHGQMGFCWMEKYAQSKAPADLDKAVEEYEKATELVKQDSVRHSLFLAAGTGRHARFELTHDQKDIESATLHFAEADRRAPDDAPEKVIILNNAGAANALLYGLTNDLQLLDKAIGFLKRIPPLQSTHELGETTYARIAELYRKRYECTQDVSDLQAVLEYEEKYLNKLPAAALEREYQLIKICRDYLLLFDRSESIADLEAAIRSARALAKQASNIDMQLGASTMLTDFLLKHYRLTSDKPDLDEALENARKAAALCSNDSPLRATVQALLGATLGFLHQKTGLAEYHQESTRVLDELRKQIDGGEKADTFIYTTIGHFLDDRFVSLGDLDDLENSLEYYKKALVAYEGNPKSPGLYTNLGNVFSDLYSAAGNLQYLNEAIEAWGEAVRLSTADSPYHSTRLNNLGSGWLLLYRHSRDPHALVEAVQLTRESVKITDPGAVNLAVHLSYLGQTLLARYELAGNIEDLHDAVAAFQKGLNLTRPGTSVYFQLVTSLGQSLRKLFEATGKMEFLSTSIDTLSRSMESMLPTSRFFTDILAVSGANYQILYEHDKREQSRELMEQFYRRACQNGIPLRLDIVLDCSQWWGDWAIGRKEWATAAEAYGYGIQALGKLYQAQVLRSEKETWLSQAQRIHSRAAYASAQAGRVKEAIEVLEAGRARLLVEVLERHRAELNRLPELGHAEIFQRYSQAVERLAYFERQELQPKQESSATDIAGEIWSAQRDLDEAVKAIQQIHEYEHLFAAPPFEQIRGIYKSLQAKAGQAAVVVYLLVISLGGLAIILDSDHLESVPFELTESELDALLISKDREKTPGGYLSVQFATHRNEALLDRVMETLSSKMMQTIAKHLAGTASTDSENRGTLILVPTGRLSLFPLHAIPCAANGASWTLLDQFEVAFIPSLRSLNHCIERLASLPEEAVAVSAVGNPLPMPEGFGPLKFARPEVEEIARQFRGPNTLQCEDKAKRADVEACLDSAVYLHFSCHGQFDPQDAMLSGILLSGGERFTLRDLVTRTELPNARLVVLSACQTAIAEFNVLPEEAIGLPSGFLQAGLPGVVGSLWPVQEISTALLMIQFYRYHLHGDPAHQIPPLPPMWALRKAQLWLRSLTNTMLADIFNGYRKAAVQKQSGIPLQLAQSQFQTYVLSPPNDRPYSNLYYWGAFAYFGI